MQLDVATYRDKVRGCWLGKNIGGTLGYPFEKKRGVFEIDFYTHDYQSGVLPNDDLDLQLVWLCAAERYGKTISAELLGEYWISYIIPNWSEYGAGKNNLAMGLQPPLSGWYENPYRNSNGCFIRSEIWACLAPGHPQIAARYAYEDAIVDHSDEGVYAEIFCAALESAAFCERDRERLIEIGLSYIPENCDVALACRTVKQCYDSGLDWKQARKKLLQTVPGSFGMSEGYGDRPVEEDVPVGTAGYDAPSNIGIMVLGWYYGEGDFSKSLCIAVGCGEDADCTAATLGSILGILSGAGAIPQKWIAPIGDEIKTVSIDLTSGKLKIPRTVSELTERVCNLMPAFLTGCFSLAEPSFLEMNEGTALLAPRCEKIRFQATDWRDGLNRQPFCVRRCGMAFTVDFDYIDGIKIVEGTEKRVALHFENNLHKQQWLTIRWHLPPDWTVSTGRESCFCLDQIHSATCIGSMESVIIPNGLTSGRYSVIIEITSNGRLSPVLIPVVFVV